MFYDKTVNNFLNSEKKIIYAKKRANNDGFASGFQKSYGMVWYFSNYVLLAKNYLAIYQLKFYLQGLVSSIQMVKFLELNAQPTTTR